MTAGVLVEADVDAFSCGGWRSRGRRREGGRGSSGRTAATAAAASVERARVAAGSVEDFFSEEAMNRTRGRVHVSRLR